MSPRVRRTLKLLLLKKNSLKTWVGSDKFVYNDIAHPKSDPSWTQFRLTVGAPDAEAKFKKAIEAAGKFDVNAVVYPVLYVRIDIKPDRPDAYLILYAGFPWIST